MSIETTQNWARGAATGDLGAPPNLAGALSPIEEKRLARELSPRMAWPTLALAVILPALYLGIAQFGWIRMLPLWACAVVLTIVAYAHYTLVHEAIHDNLVPGHPRLRWLNPVVGWIGALALGYNWPSLMRSHVLHHAHTNTAEDPDIYVKGGFGALLFKTLTLNVLVQVPLFVLRFVAPQRYRDTSYYLQGSEKLQADAVSVAMLGSLALSVAIGRFADWLCLLFLPAVGANLLLAVLFQWLPHHPFDRTERYLNTRISLWRGGGVFTLQQNYHLIHHLWPGVPFYNYGRLYRRLHPTLAAKGSRIEGFVPRSQGKGVPAE